MKITWVEVVVVLSAETAALIYYIVSLNYHLLVEPKKQSSYSIVVATRWCNNN